MLEINKNPPRIALIGCGAVAEIFYLPALAKHPSVLENLIVVDPSEERVQQFCKDFNIKDYLLDHRDVLKRDVDGVIITAPNHFHHPIAMDFLAEGIHILCEKPLAVTADKAREMVEKAKESGSVLLTNYQRRLYASYIKVKELLESRAFGAPLSFHYSEGQKYSWPIVSGSRFDTKLSSRGVLLDRGAHVLDTACWWLGSKPKLISSRNDSFGGCEAVANIEFEHKRCKGEIQLSLLGKLPCIFRVECEHGIIEGDIYDFQNIVMTNSTGKKKRLKLKAKENSYTDFGNTIVSNFLDIISNGVKPLIPGSVVLDSIEWIDECYEAATRFDMPWYDDLSIDHTI
jgi:predicted dehydrogenase